MSRDVYVVHCIDTEGPLYESIEATFMRLKEIFGIDLEPTRENLKKIQNEEINLGGQEKLISDAFAEKRINTMGTWDQLDSMLNTILSAEYREKIVDSDNKGWVYNWFCLDHVGFWGNNPRRRDVGYGNVYRHYYSELKSRGQINQDLLQFHYHPLPFNGDYNYAGTAYVNSNNLFTILARKIIDDHFFPTVYRAGMEAERPDAHWFLEQWIPFDFSCNSYLKENMDRQPDLRDGRYGDWRRATRHWHPYHPSHDDYQVEGDCKRWISRCLSLDSRLISLTKKDIQQAFDEAEESHSSILSFSSHDFRDLESEVDKCRQMIAEVIEKNRDVSVHFVTALEAMRKAEKLKYSKCNLQARLEKQGKNAYLSASVDELTFGTQPFLAIKTKSNDYLWDNFDYSEDKLHWSYVFDDKSLHIDAIDTIGIAINSSYGITEIIIINAEDGKQDEFVLNDIKM